MTDNLTSRPMGFASTRIQGFALQYESYDHEDFCLEVRELALHYDPLFDRQLQNNLFITSQSEDLFQNLGTTFYEVGSVDYGRLVGLSYRDLEGLRGGLTRPRRRGKGPQDLRARSAGRRFRSQTHERPAPRRPRRLRP